MPKELTEKQQLIKGWKARIKMHEKYFRAMVADHADQQKRYQKKLKLERMQLAALTKKGK